MIQKSGDTKFNLENRFIDLAVSLCEIAENLPNTRTGNHIAAQLIRCGTAPSSNYGEAQSGESRRDFVHKLKICLKELRECVVWLKLIDRLKLDATGELAHALMETDELIAIAFTSISTAQKNLSRQ